MSRKLTKTNFMLFTEAERHLWAFSHGKIIDKPFTAHEILMQKEGYKIEKKAFEYLRDYIAPSYKEGTDKGTHDVLFEQITAVHDNYESRADVLMYDPKEDVYDIYEIKSGTKVEKEHVIDAAFQYMVMRHSRKIRKVYLVIANKDYIRQGELNLPELFLIEDRTEEIKEKQEEIEVEASRAYLALTYEYPSVLLSCVKPKECLCPEVCFEHELPEYSIYTIPRLGEKKKRELQDEEIFDAGGVPEEFKLTANQQLYVNVVKSKGTKTKDKAIKKKLDELVFPLYFLDYETFNPGLPLYDGYKPYQQMVFQYSLHILRDKGDLELEHYEYVDLENRDPAKLLVEHMKQHIGDIGSVIVWNKGFECGRNEDMAVLYPEYADFLKNVNARVFDLMEIFSKNLYVDYRFKGSKSIKAVLPVLVPGLSYKTLNIQNGADAMTGWYEAVHGDNTSETKKKQVRADLLKYCELDTKAMWEIWRVLK